ncbi:Vacuolar-sorting protein BRO1 [Camellia lanceoleosa]|uniref:Vacuolar-sorting protein BRO1 n=1 Tax=Camellia lanceoleosa TaxID=1840588 RepID=A0ACC0HKG0_9ERIC|nr:Vacuolar-sorting protein BRO1 [Camellia lanceoleosa]
MVDCSPPLLLSKPSTTPILPTPPQLRSDLERATVDSLTSRCDLIQSYYKALCAVESRFQISDDEDPVKVVTFTWHMMFNVGNVGGSQLMSVWRLSVDVDDVQCLKSDVHLRPDLMFETYEHQPKIIEPDVYHFRLVLH